MKTELRVVESQEEFEKLRDDWNILYEESLEATIFLSWDWMFTWWDVFHKHLNTELLILCLYKDEKLCGLAPFHILKTFPKSLIQGKTLSFLGSGEAKKDTIVSQYMDFLVDPEMDNQFIDAVSQYLFENKNKWNFADFEFLLRDSKIARCFESENLNILTNLTQYGSRYYISDSKNFDEFQSKMANRWNKMLRKKSRKIEKDGDVIIDTSNDVGSAKLAYRRLKKMHEARWGSNKSIFNSTAFNEFHLKLLERLVPQDKAYISTLCLDDKALATYYCFTDKEQIHYYQSGFYKEYANKYSPLFLLVCKEIKRAIESNIKFDFMFDDSDASYKKEQYAADLKPMYRLKWSPSKSRMSIHKSAKVIQTKAITLKCTFLSVIQKIKKLVNK